MAITRSEFETAAKVIEEAICRNGDLRVSLSVMKNTNEAFAIRKSLSIVKDWYKQSKQNIATGFAKGENAR